MTAPAAPAANHIKRSEEAVGAAAEILLANVVLFAMDAFGHLKLTVPGFLTIAAIWPVGRAWLAWRAWRDCGVSRVVRLLVELFIPLVWAASVGSQLKLPWTIPQAAYAALAIQLTWLLWRGLLRQVSADRRQEAARWLLLGGACAGSMAPFFTDLVLGGTDARWYAGVHIDFLQQLRAGVFPVFVGQGEYSFNGSVNLFRTAPLCLWVAGVWDWLTAQALAPIAVRNLSIVSLSLAAGFCMYAALVNLVSTKDPGTLEGRRWLAAGVAAIYVLCPGVLFSLYLFELQMTFTALVALPWIFYGNLRTLIDREGVGYRALAVGLALAWYAHAPLAIISTLATATVQIGRFVFEPGALAKVWRPAAEGAVLFALLTAFYFAGMTELPPALMADPKPEILLLGALGMAIVGTIRFFWRWEWPALALALAGGGMVTWLSRPWLAWCVAWVALFGIVAGLIHWRRLKMAPAHWALLAAVCMLGAAALAQRWAVYKGLAPELQLTSALDRNRQVWMDLFWPVKHRADAYGNTQPGLGIWLLSGSVLFAAGWRRNLPVTLMAMPLILLLAMILAVPGVSDFLVGYAPPYFGSLVTLPMLYRLVPILAAGVAVIGFHAMVSSDAGSLKVRWVTGVLAVAVVGWSAWEARYFIKLGKAFTHTRTGMEIAFSPDNFTLGRYPYLMLKIPPRFIDGKQVYWLESRLLDQRWDVVFGPDQQAALAERFESQTYELTSQWAENSTDWIDIGPSWEIQPGEQVILRWEFPQDRNSSGWLVFRSARGYQEQYLNPGYTGTGFGIGRHSSSVTAVTNSGRHTERYRMQLKLEPGNDLPRDGAAWGKLHLSRYNRERAPIQVQSLVPFRATVTANATGYLETPRQWLAGYAAKVDGKWVEVVRSRDGMVAVPLAAGTHEVVLRFLGSGRLWVGLVTSVVAWGMLAAVTLAGGWANLRTALSVAGGAIGRWRGENSH